MEEALRVISLSAKKDGGRKRVEHALNTPCEETVTLRIRPNLRLHGIQLTSKQKRMNFRSGE
jgi:hypothetical protein